MSEQNFQRTSDDQENSNFDDPLAELARIVSGEETGTAGQDHSIDQRQADLARLQNNANANPPNNAGALGEQSVNPEMPVAPEMEDLESNPFAKYIVEPVPIAEPPATQQSQQIPVDNQVAQVPSGVAEVPVVDDQQASDAFTSEFEAQLPEMLEAGLGQAENVSQQSQQVGNDDLESELLAGLEIENHAPMHSEAAEQHQQAAADQNSVNDFEASLEQNLGMTGEQTAPDVQDGYLSGNNIRQSAHHSEMQAEMDAVMSSLDHSVAASAQSGQVQAEQQASFGEQNAVTPEQDEALREFNEVLSSFSPSQQVVPPQAPPQQAIAQEPVAPQAIDPGLMQAGVQQQYAQEQAKPASSSLFHAEEELIADENQINASVHALQNDVVETSDIENAFSDAFAEEFSMEMQSEPAFAQSGVQQQPVASQDPISHDQHFAGQDQLQAFEQQVPGQQPVVSDYNPYLEEESPLAALEQERLELDSTAADSSSSGSGLRMAAIALGGAMLIGGGIVAYGMLGNNGTADDPVLVKADTRDFKVKPEDTGGKKIANQDQPVYTNMTGEKNQEDSQQKLVTTELEPVDLNNRDATTKSSERLSATQSNENQNSTSTFVQPRRVKTVIVKADGTFVTSSGTEVTDLNSVKSTEVAALNNSSNTTASNTTKASLDGAVSSSEIPVPSLNPFISRDTANNNSSNVVNNFASNQPVDLNNSNKKADNNTPVNTLTTALDKKVETEVRQPAEQLNRNVANNSAVKNVLSSPNVYKVQISSQRSQEAAESSYQNLKTRFAGLLEGQQREIRAVDVDGKGTFYRVQIPIGEMTEAADFCKRYKAAGGSCFVTR